MLSIDPHSTINDHYIQVRKSMMKFDSNDWTLEIVDHSRLSKSKSHLAYSILIDLFL